jgi:guanosine-3',5'-bis(diphosphate) 3'-pyrophosphohydrolase
MSTSGKTNIIRSSAAAPAARAKTLGLFSSRSVSVQRQEYLRRVQAIARRFRKADDRERVLEAFELAWQGHRGEFRRDGSLFVSHPVAVAEIVGPWRLGAEGKAAALGHDLIEKGMIRERRVTRAYLEKKVGPRVANLVEGVTEFGKEPGFKGEEPSEAEILSKLLDYQEKDPRIIFVKLGDRLHNMRTLEYMGRSTQLEKARETLHVYSRIADRLGMWELKRELEDLSWMYLEPEEYARTERSRDEIVRKSRRFVRHIAGTLKEKMKAQGLSGRVVIEKRCVYELHQRIKKRKMDISRISASDVWRINIVVEDEAGCYAALHQVHKAFSPIQDSRENIKDYIANPCVNGHRLLHTWVNALPKGNLTPDGRLLVQIRDKEMQLQYKKGVTAKAKRYRNWYKDAEPLLDALHKIVRGREGLEDLYSRIAAASSPIKVHDVHGAEEKELTLLRGATVLDFSFFSSPGFFQFSRGGVVNGNAVELSHELQEGDSVRMIYGPSFRPRVSWVEWIRTPEALSALQEHIRKYPGRKDIVRSTYEYLDKKLKRHRLSADGLLARSSFAYFIGEEMQHGSLENFIYRLANAEVTNLESQMNRFMKWCRTTAKACREQGRIEQYPVMAVARDRLALSHEFTQPIGEQGINLSLVVEGGTPKAEMVFVGEVCDGSMEKSEVKEMFPGKRTEWRQFFVNPRKKRLEFKYNVWRKLVRERERSDQPEAFDALLGRSWVGEVGEIQKMQIRNIIHDVKGVELVTTDRGQIGVCLLRFEKQASSLFKF